MTFFDHAFPLQKVSLGLLTSSLEPTEMTTIFNLGLPELTFPTGC